MILISSKELINKHNISYQTLNFYTTLGLFQVKKRIGNRRFYDENEFKDRLEIILRMKEEGYPLRMIVHQLNQEASHPKPNGGIIS